MSTPHNVCMNQPQSNHMKYTTQHHAFELEFEISKLLKTIVKLKNRYIDLVIIHGIFSLQERCDATHFFFFIYSFF